MYKIGELSRESGLSTHTLRFYEKNGLFKASGRSHGNYRLYSENDLKTAQFIRHSRELGFSLEEVQAFLSIRSDKEQHICEDAKRITAQKIEEVKDQIKHLQQLLVALEHLSDACCGGDESATQCSIIESLEDTTA